VAHASAPFIAFLDSDDFWTQDKLSRQLEIAGREDQTAHFIIYNTVTSTGTERAVRFPRRAFDPGYDDISPFLSVEGNYIQTSGLLMPTRTALAYPFNTALRRHQDLDLIIAAQRAGVKLIHCDAPTVLYDDTPAEDRVGAVRNPEPTIVWVELRWDWL